MTTHPLDLSLVSKLGTSTATFDDGAVIFSEGERGTVMYVVQSGEVSIEHHSHAMVRVGPGGVFGEMALIDGSPRSATVRAVGTTEVTAIDEKSFLFLVDEMPFFALHLLRILAERLRAMNELV